MSLNEKIFRDKTLSNLFEEIYDTSKKKEAQIKSIIKSLQPLIQEDIGNATLIMPLMSEWMELSLRNDDQLVKIAGIVQKMFNTGKGGDGNNSWNLTEEERVELLKEIEKMSSPNNNDT